VLVYARTHTPITPVLDVSAGVDRTLGEPERSRSTKAQHKCLTAFLSCHMSFLLRKVKDVTTISKPQSLTSVRIKDCTLRVPYKTAASFLSEQ